MDILTKLEANKRWNKPFLNAFDFICKKNGMRQSDLASEMGTNSSLISAYRKGTKRASENIMNRLSMALDGKLNIYYLKGESQYMLVDNIPKEELLAKEFKRTNPDYDILHNGAMPQTNMTENGVPYYDVDFELGFDEMENDQTRTPDGHMDLPQYNSCTCLVHARGDSMMPTISSGDIIALKKIEDFRYLISGEIYAIVTKNGLRTIKRVNDKGESIQLIPDNKDYEEQSIPKAELLHVFVVKGCMKAY